MNEVFVVRFKVVVVGEGGRGYLAAMLDSYQSITMRSFEPYDSVMIEAKLHSKRERGGCGYMSSERLVC